MGSLRQSVATNVLSAFSLPLFTYGLNVIHLSAGQLNKLNIAWNNVYRKIFGMKPESVKEIQFLCGRLDFKHLIDLSKMRFYHNSATCSLCIVQCCLSRTMRLAIVKTLFYSYVDVISRLAQTDI